MTYRNFQIAELNFEGFYDNGTRPEGRLFTYNNHLRQISSNWKAAHLKEVLEFLKEKWILSQRIGTNSGLIMAARHYFSSPEKVEGLYEIASQHEVALAELSLIVHEDSNKRIFIPNLSISHAQKRIRHSHETIDDFFNSNSYMLIKLISQSTAANHDCSLPQADQDARVLGWIDQYGTEAEHLLKESLYFDKENPFVGGISPDIVLKDLGHRPFGEIATPFTLERVLAS